MAFTPTRTLAAVGLATTTLFGFGLAPVAAETSTFQVLDTIQTGSDPDYFDYGVSGDSHWIIHTSVYAGVRTLSVENWSTGEVRSISYEDGYGFVNPMSLSHDGSKGVFSDADGTHVWDTKTGATTLVAAAGTEAVSISPDGSQVIVEGIADEVRNTATGELVQTLDGSFHLFTRDGRIMDLSLNYSGGTDNPEGTWTMTAAVMDDGIETEYVNGEICDAEIFFCGVKHREAFDDSTFGQTIAGFEVGEFYDYFYVTYLSSKDGAVLVELDGSTLYVLDGSGHPSPSSVANAKELDQLVHAYDYTTEDARVTRLYQAYFARTPDVGGLAYWIDLHHQGYSVEDISSWISASDEYNNLYAGTSNAEYVAKIYENVLGRDYDQEGYDYWLGLLDAGALDRAGIVFWVTANQEFINNYPFMP